jgi:tetratricopeptide (TPR) repeat protein
LDFLQRVWQAIPGGDMLGEGGFISAVLGVIAFIAFAAWLSQRFRRHRPEMSDAEDSERIDHSERFKRIETIERLKRIEDILIGRARAQSAFLAGGDQPGAKQAEAIVEHDIGAAISTLAQAGQIEAAEAAERGVTEAADNALAARIAKIDGARLGAAKEEAALYRQRGGLAYTDDPRAALRFYARAAELDPEHMEGLLALAQLRIRAGSRPAPKQTMELPIALEHGIEDEPRPHWVHPFPEDFAAAHEDRNAASGRYERAPPLVNGSIQRDPNDAEWRRDPVSHDCAVDPGGAARAYLDRLGIAKKLAALDSNEAERQRDLLGGYDRAGDNNAGPGNREDTLKACLDGLGIAKELAGRDPGNAEWRRELCLSYDKTGDICAGRGDREDALKAYLDGLEMAKNLAALDPSNAEWQHDLLVSYNLIGEICADRGDLGGALKAYSDGLEITKQLAARDPNNAEWQRELSVSCDRVGDVCAAQGDRDGALKAYADGFEISSRLSERDPENATWQTDLVVSAWKLAETGAEDGRAHIANGLAILKRLDAKGELAADQKEWIAAFEEALRESVELAPQG